MIKFYFQNSMNIMQKINKILGWDFDIFRLIRIFVVHTDKIFFSYVTDYDLSSDNAITKMGLNSQKRWLNCLVSHHSTDGGDEWG